MYGSYLFVCEFAAVLRLVGLPFALSFCYLERAFIVFCLVDACAVGRLVF